LCFQRAERQKKFRALSLYNINKNDDFPPRRSVLIFASADVDADADADADTDTAVTPTP